MISSGLTALCLVSWPLQLAADAAPTDLGPRLEPYSERVLEKEVRIRAGLDSVWDAWTTERGIRFLSPESRIEPRPGGPYELFLHLPPDEQGRRGAEGSRVLTVLPRRLLVFDWTFPPAVPDLRRAGAKTHVALLFEPGDNGVRVRLVQYGWREGPEWEAGYRYFDEAWSGVLRAMKIHLEAEEGVAPRAPSEMLESRRAFPDVLRIDEEVAIDAPPAVVWKALTTPAGLAGWIAPESRVDLRPGGAYELYFFPDQPDRGMEGTRILAFIPNELLAHTGEAPETWVVWRLEPADGGTLVRFTGLGTSPEWAERKDYFERVTPDVLDRLKRWVETGVPTRGE